MDSVRGFGDGRFDSEVEGDEIDDTPVDSAGNGVAETQIDVGTDERRMHVRAYNHWVSLLGGRAYPSIEDLDPANIADFGPHSVLLDFSLGIENPAIAYLGRALREECSLDSSVTHISQVPSRSLLSRLTDHYLQIIANRSPIGFEAEFVGVRGHNTLYRGILMPFSSDDESIDFIYGVINWKELVDAETQAKLHAEIAAAVSSAPMAPPAAPIWADGPSAGFDSAEADDIDDAAAAATGGNLADQLMLAQQTAAAVRAADVRGRATLYRALGRAHDFAAAADADPQSYRALLESAGIVVQLRAPMTPVVKLVFGSDYDKTRLTEYAAVLSYARRIDVATGQLGEFLEGFEGGIKGIVKAERAARTPVAKPRASSAGLLASRPTLASVAIETPLERGAYVVLLARANDGGMLDIVATLGDDTALTERAMRSAV
ncbi:hypothetical protein GCM10008023_17500 [Sphingomonas glacialis]|uniref:Uncharacterized protein n=1 Tax=Sphingomonas glacialis TaxID=658225 RepID=A0ABQ3LLS4_9SPHN|nr:hypothetical protein [Sphingomonas glacialis]GHH15093.1 hypothetical protein GCM10008023_17500 [Sphingomonas glacialis]